MRRIPALLALTCWISPACADLSIAEPKQLCALLDDYGIKTSEFVAPGERERPLCYTISQPANIVEDGYEYSYRVLSHWELDIVNGLFVQLAGRPEKILGKAPQATLASMVERVLSALIEESEVEEILTAFHALYPGEQRSAAVQGLSVQIQFLEYSLGGLGSGILLRLDVNNICNFPPSDEQGREQCVSENRDLRWSEVRR